MLFVVTKSNLGGAQRYVYDIATNLPKDSFEPVVLCGTAQGKTSAGILIERLTHANIRTIFVPELSRDVSMRDFRTYRAIFNAINKERPDVLHLNSSKAGILGAFAGRRCKVPNIIFTVHGWAFRESRNPLSRFVIYLLSLLTVALSHSTICISEYDIRPFSRFKSLSRKISVIRNAIKPEDFMFSRESARVQLLQDRSHDKDMWIGSIGELTANKNTGGALLAVAGAIRKNPNIFYAIIGDGEERDLLEQTARKMQIANRVRFAGYIPNAARLLPAFDIFFLPSLKEGSPYVLLEAASAGIPVIASSAGGIPEMIENGKSGMVCHYSDTECFTQGIISLASDENKRAEHAHALKARIGNAGEFDRMMRETLALYV